MPVINYKGDYDSLSDWATCEYRDALLSRRGYEIQLDEYDRQYEQVPKVAKKTFPWDGASNLEVPLGATHVDTIVSRIEDAYFATQPWVICRSLNGKYEANCAALQDYMNTITLPASGYRAEKAVDLLQTAKLGTSFQFLTYETIDKHVMGVDGKRLIINVHEGPVQQTIHPRHLITPPDTRSIERARWMAIRSFKTWGEISDNVNRGIYDRAAVEAIEGSGITNTKDTARERRQGLRRSGKLRQWEIVSMCCLYQDQAYSIADDLWLDFHYPSGTILRAIYNPWLHFQWPFNHSVYMFREDAFLGLGIMAMLNALQQEITDIHNYCLDNMLAANTVMILAKANSVANIDISPMGLLEYKGNKDDIRIERLGSAISGQQVGEAAAHAMAESRTGAADGSVNRISPSSGLSSSRTPATTTMALIGESNKRFALAIENNKRADSRLLMQHALLLKQYWSRQRRLADLWDMDKARLIEELFTLDIDAFRHGVIIEVTASSLTINKELERNNLLVLGDFMQKYYQTFISYLTLLSQYPALDEVIRKILNGAARFVEQVLRTFDIKDPESYIPSIDDIGGRAATQPQTSVDELHAAFLNGAVGGNNGGGAPVRPGG
jgi:hypothetical protein